MLDREYERAFVHKTTIKIGYIMPSREGREAKGSCDSANEMYVCNGIRTLGK